jgi:hypothetical protein
MHGRRVRPLRALPRANGDRSRRARAWPRRGIARAVRHGWRRPRVGECRPRSSRGGRHPGHERNRPAPTTAKDRAERTSSRRRRALRGARAGSGARDHRILRAIRARASAASAARWTRRARGPGSGVPTNAVFSAGAGDRARRCDARGTRTRIAAAEPRGRRDDACRRIRGRSRTLHGRRVRRPRTQEHATASLRDHVLPHRRARNRASARSSHPR